MATGDITSVAVDSGGCLVTMSVEGMDGTLITALESGTSATLAVVSEGYDNTGSLGTVARTVETRFISATGSSPATVTLGLSEPIYDDDQDGGAGTSGTDPTFTITAGAFDDGSNTSNAVSAGAATNNSTLDYPKVIGRWVMPAQIIFGADYAEYFGFQSANGETAYLEVDAFHYFGIACVIFTLDDGSSSVTSTETAWTQSLEESPSWKTGGTWLYRAELDVTGIANGVLDGDFQAYPVVGDADSVRDTNDGTWPTTDDGAPPTYKFFNNEGNSGTAITPVYAYYDPDAGGSGTASTTEGTASADPFPDLWDALDAAGAAAVTAGNPSETGGDTASGVIIKCEEGNLICGDMDGTRVVSSNAWVIITAAPGTTKANVNFNREPTTSGLRTNRIMLHNVTVTQSASYLNIFRSSGFAAGSDTTRGIWWKGVHWVGNYSTTSSGLHAVGAGTNFEHQYYTDCTSEDTYNAFRGGAPFAVLARNCLTVDAESDTFSQNRMTLDCEVQGGISVSLAHPDIWQNIGATGDANCIIRDLLVLNHENQTLFNNSVDCSNIAFINCLTERVGSPGGGYGQWINCTGDHILWWHVSHPGQGYNWRDDSTIDLLTNTSVRNCSFSDAIVVDTSGGIDTLEKGCGVRDNHTRENPNDLIGFGINTTGDPGYTDDLSQDTTDTGGGNYVPTEGGALHVLTEASQIIVPRDLYGVERTTANNSMGALAAVAPSITIRAETSANALPYSLVQCSLDISRYALIDTTTYSWTVSPSQAGEYYLKQNGSGNPATTLGAAGTITAMQAWHLVATTHRVKMREGTLGSLLTYGYAFGDNDSLGYNTLYVRMDDSGAPASEEIVCTFDEGSTTDSSRWEECDIEWWLDQTHGGTTTALASWSGVTRYVTDPRDGSTQIDLAGSLPTSTTGSPIKGPLWQACLPAGSYQIKCRVTNKGGYSTDATATFTVNAESRTVYTVNSAGGADYTSVAAAVTDNRTLIEVEGGHAETLSASMAIDNDDTYIYWTESGVRPVVTSTGNFFWHTRYNGVTVQGMDMRATTVNTVHALRFVGNTTSGATNCAAVDCIASASGGGTWAHGWFAHCTSDTTDNCAKRLGIFNCTMNEDAASGYSVAWQSDASTAFDVGVWGCDFGTSTGESCIRQTNATWRFSLHYTAMEEDEKDCLRLVQGGCNWAYGNKALNGAFRVGATATTADHTSRIRIEANLFDGDTLLAAGLAPLAIQEGVSDCFICNNVHDGEVALPMYGGSSAPGTDTTYFAGYQSNTNIIVVHNTADVAVDSQVAFRGSGVTTPTYVSNNVISNNVAAVQSSYTAFEANAATLADNDTIVASMGPTAYGVDGASSVTTYAGVRYDYSGTVRASTSLAGANGQSLEFEVGGPVAVSGGTNTPSTGITTGVG
jgi:hypothetical protein